MKRNRTRTSDGMTRAIVAKNDNATAEFLEKLDDGWRQFWLKRGNVLPHVPTSYLITHNRNPDGFGGLSPS